LVYDTAILAGREQHLVTSDLCGDDLFISIFENFVQLLPHSCAISKLLNDYICVGCGNTVQLMLHGNNPGRSCRNGY